MKLGSLFDGSGGFPLAGSLCGIEPRWAAEVEPYPIAVTRSRFPNMKHLGSVTDVNGAEIEPVDIITFGSPCQDLSVAGKRAGLKHEANGDDETTRSGLFMEAVRIIKEMREATNGRRPDFVLWENVPGAFSSNNGEDFRTVLAELIRIIEPNAAMPPVPKGGWAYADSYTGDGWSLAYRVFDAQYWGVPQRRRRIHLVLDLRGERARKVLFEREGLRGYFAQSGATRQGTAADVEGGSGADDREGKNCLNPWDSQTIRVYAANGVFPTLSGNSGGGQNRQSVCIPGACRIAAYVDITHADDVVRVDDTVAPLQARDHKGGKLVQIQYIVRRLTPTECARLQGFADRWGWIDEKDSLTAEEYQFWLDVRNTHAAINGKAVKQYTVEQMLKWYNQTPHGQRRI